MDLKRGIDKAVMTAIDQLKNISKSIAGDKAIAQVATISANGDQAIGDTIARAMHKVGKDGAITVEEGKSLEDELEFVEGMQFDRGYLSPYFINNRDNLKCELGCHFYFSQSHSYVWGVGFPSFPLHNLKQTNEL